MRKVYFLLLAAMIFTCGNAQQNEITGFKKKEIKTGNIIANKTNSMDTLTQYRDRASDFYLLSAGTTGYVLGTNSISNETGNHYDSIGNASVTEIMVYFAHKQIMGSPDSVYGKVYATSSVDSMPVLPLLALDSAAISLSDIDTSGLPTFIQLNNAVYTNSGLFVSVKYGHMNDTVAVLSSNPLVIGGGPDGAMEKRTRQIREQGFFRAYDVWTLGGVPYNADAMIIPIVDIQPISIQPGVTTPEMTLRGAYPNPASDVTTIHYSLDRPQTIRFTLFDGAGRVLYSTEEMNKPEGDHEYKINLEKFSAGKYYYRIDTKNSFLMSKIIVVK